MNELKTEMTVEQRLDELRQLVLVLVERQQVRDYYSVEEFARLVGRAEFTVREWCRNGRIKADKKESGRGRYQAWVISHEELQRFQKEGLLPIGRLV